MKPMRTENRLLQILKSKNRTLLEVYTGVLVLAVLTSGIGLILPYQRLRAEWQIRLSGFEAAVWVAAVLAVLSYFHMYRSLDKALDFDEGNAQKMIFKGYLFRYVTIAVILIAVAVTGWIDPLILCLGYLLFMKVAAYLQPYTHRFYNLVFREKDPVPEPLPEEEKEVTK